jgi:hypothetical protein
MRRVLVPTLFLALAAAPGLRAEDAKPIPMLEKHPLADAKPGEFMRWKQTAGEETEWFIIRVLAVKEKENKVFLEVYKTSEDGKEDQNREMSKWIEVPEFKPKENQTFKTDEMVVREIAGKKVTCRHLKIEEPVNPPWSQPVRTREVWYSNDVLATGKVEEWVEQPPSVTTAVDWGMLSPEELQKRIDHYDELKTSGGDKPADKPADKPSDKPSDKPADKPKDGEGIAR